MTIFYIYACFISLICYSFFTFNFTLLNSTLCIILGISIIKFVDSLYGYVSSYEKITNGYQKMLKEREDLLENMRIDLVITTIKSDYFSLLYSSKIQNNEMFEMAKKDMINIGVPQHIVSDPTKMGPFLEKLIQKKIKVKFLKDEHKFEFIDQLGKIINNNK